jgi:large subunit ribosomal protein L32
MAVPKQKHTKSRRDKTRSHIFLKTPSFNICPKFGKPILPHAVCFNCGYYKGAEVIDVLKKLTKKERKKKEKELKAKEEAEKREAKKEGALSWEELSKK